MADRNGYIGRAPGDSAVTVARQSYTSSGITTDFTFSSGYVTGYFDLYINGVKMIEGSDYTSSDGSTFSVLNGGAADGDVLEAVAYKAFNAAAIDSAPGNFSVAGFVTSVGGYNIGIQSAGSVITSGPVTTLNFVGTGNTFAVDGTTVDISIAGGGGGGGSIGTTGITTQTIFSNPNTISEDQMLTVPGSNYGVFGPVSVGAAVTVGAGNTFVIV